MNRKNRRLIGVVLVVILGLIVPIIYADSSQVLYIPTSKVKIGEAASVYINLDNTEYEISKIILSTNIYIEPTIDVSNTNITIDNSAFNPQTRELIINDLSGGIICVSYLIPSYLAGGTKINVTLTIFENDEEVGAFLGEINVASDEKPVNNIDTNNTIINEKPENNIIANRNMINTNTINMNMINGTNRYTETVTYKGSRNNYLTNIVVNGYELEPSFNKTNNTYFITVSNDVTSIDVSGIKEDSTASVTVSGNTNLKEGLNKVLISVTAQNGDMRYYRVYVTKEGDV